MARSLFDMGWSLANNAAKLGACDCAPMPEATTSHVELTCLQGLAELERLEGPWLEEMAIGDPETVAINLRLLMAHMVSISKRLNSAMVLDRLDAEDRARVSISETGCDRRLI